LKATVKKPWAPPHPAWIYFLIIIHKIANFVNPPLGSILDYVEMEKRNLIICVTNLSELAWGGVFAWSKIKWGSVDGTKNFYPGFPSYHLVH
jgi:hypothetical protein